MIALPRSITPHTTDNEIGDEGVKQEAEVLKVTITLTNLRLQCVASICSRVVSVTACEK